MFTVLFFSNQLSDELITKSNSIHGNSKKMAAYSTDIFKDRGRVRRSLSVEAKRCEN
jgi:hypothetical protein